MERGREKGRREKGRREKGRREKGRREKGRREGEGERKEKWENIAWL
ncbi:MAG: hypothetical protein ACTSU2_17770 [Promethearchaeota archaeon]